MSIESLEPRIREILASADLETISAKRVRKQLLKADASLSEEWMKINKEPVDALIASVFEEVSGAQPRDEQNGGDYAGGASEERDWKENGSHQVGDDDDQEATDAGPSVQQAKPKKSKTKAELADEEYARQLSSEINGSQRASRSGKAPSGRPKKGASRTPKKDKKSAERVIDSDADTDEEQGSAKKRAKKSGGGGGAKGGFQKEFMLSAPLATLLQQDRLSRPQVVKQLWVYIKANNLQNPENKREILCDALMREVWGSDKIDMFKMNKHLGSHLYEPGEAH
ncbi:SWIB-domain-containing protein [Schizopora paradoxa]|uniref:SWIB-domain-containing protein n=1 Tax=Schizopora paradoxa TaxID=27342 RepID=A0A0H2RGV1_9AGAM|nr:SWIB-domain-containing protein [Schizopora paradoxa]